ncbi:hypothetical protein [Teredinibacter sp. KSP-S5-2]|uniref:hypothetical protein n=1 Tax=Teredinibacter sp. KSP-S5-2 TaxID=3034506 RepID=UPI0029342CA3|nr:hypothetical protein [Teredinibacter sp. KSP-S5-2]WNO08724.1 hypothetical protein P5V12_17265 [Teredinibacter sp. KSP-S5-2]
MKTVLFISLLFFVHTASAECKKDFSTLGAEYSIAHSKAHAKQTENKEHLNLWRLPKRVGHEHVEQKRFIEWMQAGTKKIRKTDYFDANKRGIEYYPEDLEEREAQSDWSIYNQFITEEFIASLSPVNTVGKGCDTLVSYQGSKQNAKFELTWFPHKKIIQSFTILTPTLITEWKLEKLHSDQTMIKQQFAQRSQYQLTDYADIGDNESDPFLLSMINLGFVKHGASGFYNAQGESMDGGHHHH